MTEDHLKSTRERSLVDMSNVSEAELHSTDGTIRESWQRLQDIKDCIAKEKQLAVQVVDKKYANELKAAMEEYAMTIMLAR